MNELRIVGKRVRRLDSLAKATGEAKYTADLKWPGMLYATILRSPHPHAKIISIDCRKAKELKGVKAVVTASDTPGKKFGPCIPDEHLLATERVRYVGDELLSVAATAPEIAEEAVELIEVKYEEIPAVFDVFAALEPGAPTIDSIVGKNLAERYAIRRGDIEKGLKESDCILEESFQLPLVNQCCIEPTTCAALLDPRGRLTVWAPTQAPFSLQNQISQALAIHHAQIRVIQPTVGGGFGSRHHIKTAMIAALLAMRTGKPVQISLEREEEFLASRPRMAANIRLLMGFGGDGTILAKKTDIMADNGAFTSSAPWFLDTTARRVDSLYRIRNIETNVSLVYTNKVPCGAFRGFGNPQMHFAVESMLDMAAERLNIDPVQIRLKNATQAGDITAHGVKISSCGLTESITTAARSSHWGKYGPAQGVPQQGRKRRGQGMGCMIHIAGRRTITGFSGSSAEVKILDSGRVVISSGEADVGQGCNNVFAQITAEVLELPLEVVEVAPLDTDQCPHAWGSFSDRVTILGGGAVRVAALDAKKQVLSLAAQFFGVTEDQLKYEGGVIHCQEFPESMEIFKLSKSLGAVEDPLRYKDAIPGQESKNSIEIFKLLRLHHRNCGGGPLLGKGAFFPDIEPFDPATKYGTLGAAYTFATQVADVEVDLDTGQVSVLGFTSVHDLGKAINPLAAEGQVEGALSQGLGYALLEEMSFEDGQAREMSFLDYKIPTVMDVPQSKVFFVESLEPHGPYGAKGVGEPGLVATAPAVANAVYQATGARITSLPITPEKVLAALEKEEKSEAPRHPAGDSN